MTIAEQERHELPVPANVATVPSHLDCLAATRSHFVIAGFYTARVTCPEQSSVMATEFT